MSILQYKSVPISFILTHFQGMQIVPLLDKSGLSGRVDKELQRCGGVVAGADSGLPVGQHGLAEPSLAWPTVAVFQPLAVALRCLGLSGPGSANQPTPAAAAATGGAAQVHNGRRSHGPMECHSWRPPVGVSRTHQQA